MIFVLGFVVALIVYVFPFFKLTVVFPTFNSGFFTTTVTFLVYPWAFTKILQVPFFLAVIFPLLLTEAILEFEDVKDTLTLGLTVTLSVLLFPL